MPDKNSLKSIFKSKALRCYLPLVPSVVMFATIAGWFLFAGPAPSSVFLDFLWLCPIVIPFLYSGLTLLVIRVTETTTKPAYNIAMRDFINRVLCTSIITMVLVWILLLILKDLYSDLKPLSEEGAGGSWITAFFLAGVVTLIFMAMLVASWFSICGGKLEGLYDPEETDEELTELSNQSEDEEV